MKRAIAALLFTAFCCILFTTCLAAEYTAGGMYKISYNANENTLDDTKYTSENTENYQWLFLLYNDDTVIDASYERINEYENLTLYSADDKTLNLYQQDVLESFADNDPVFVTVRKVGVNQIPFYIFKMKDDEGTYYMAETVVMGCAIDFMSYPNGNGELSEKNYSDLCDLLDTFEPALGERNQKSRSIGNRFICL